MTHKKLADELEIAPSTLTAWAKRGAPVDQGADAVRRWRDRNLRPYVASPAPAPQPPWRAGHGSRPRVAPALDPVDELESFLEAHALLALDDCLATLQGLGAMASERLRAGKPLGPLEGPMRSLLRALPEGCRDPLPLPLDVMTALCADAIAAVEARFPDKAAREADRQAFIAGGEAAAQEMGRFWYRVAAGELTVDPGR